jgi:hypothetical protein
MMLGERAVRNASEHGTGEAVEQPLSFEGLCFIMNVSAGRLDMFVGRGRGVRSEHR